jgi:hypothetical protein
MRLSFFLEAIIQSFIAFTDERGIFLSAGFRQEGGRMGKGKKKAPSGPRLDPKGYLNHPPDRFFAASTWVGDSVGSEVITEVNNDEEADIEWDCKLYDSVQMGDTIYRVDDAVYLTPTEKDYACEIGIIKKLYEVDDTDTPKRMTLQWMWRPEALEIPDPDNPDEELQVEAEDRELFFSSSTDDHNPIETIER